MHSEWTSHLSTVCTLELSGYLVLLSPSICVDDNDGIWYHSKSSSTVLYHCPLSNAGKQLVLTSDAEQQRVMCEAHVSE